MNCPNCQHEDHHVMDTKRTVASIRRRRKCDRCGHRWSTLEINEEDGRSERERLAKARELAAGLSAALGPG